MAEPLSFQGIVDMASAYYSSAVLFAAIDADVFGAVERLGAGATAQAVADAAGTSRRGTAMLLDACAALGLLAKDGAGAYSNTPAGRQALVPGGPADLTRAIRYNRDVYPAWGRLGEFVKTGRPAEKPSMHLGGDPERTKAFAQAMYSRAMGIGRGVVPMLGLPQGCRRVLDLAGGPGAYAVLMARSYPQIEKIVTVDLPAISGQAAEMVAAEGLQDRIECRAGDWHGCAFGEGFDAVAIFGALHQESPEAIRGILAKAAAALVPGGRIFVLDMMTDETRTAPAFSALFGLNMALTMPCGWVFSDAELKGWLAEAGFECGETRKAPPPMPHWMVAGTKKA